MPTPPWLPWLAVSAVLLAPPALALAEEEPEPGPARLVADLSAGTVETEPHGYSGFQRLGHRSVFIRQDETGHRSLWVTDGTAEGTSALGVLYPLWEDVAPLGSTGKVAFYRAGISGYVIWRTDGTLAGTFPLTRRTRSHAHFSPVTSLAGGLLFFVETSVESIETLWSSDGSVAGTLPIGSLAPGEEIHDMGATASGALVMARGASGSTALWIASRTGLALVRRLPAASGMSCSAGLHCFFVARTDGDEVWTSDGTSAGTRPVTSFASEDPGFWFSTVIGGRLYFSADDGTHGPTLWSVGTEPGSQRRLTDRPGGSVHGAGERIVFLARHSAGFPLWSSQGDLESSAPVATGCPEGCPFSVDALVPLTPEKLIVYGDDEERRGKFWVTDGTAAGTRLLRMSGRNGWSARGISADGRALFEVAAPEELGDLWVTDGTTAGTSFVTQGGRGWIHSYTWSGELSGGVTNGQVVFPGRVGEGYSEALWSSDGTPSGSRLITGPHRARSSLPRQLMPFREGLLLQTCNGSNGVPAELWFVPGAGKGEPILLHSQTCSELTDWAQVVVLGDVALFLWFGERTSLWRTDGTPEGTVPLFSEAHESRPKALVRWGDKAAIWVSAPSGSTFRSELWVTDGIGILKYLELPPGTEMHGLTAAAGRLWFFDKLVRRGNRLWQPWVSDGSRAGTHPLTSSAGSIPKEWLADPVPFVAAGDRVYFRFARPFKPLAIWRTDGTLSGTAPALTPASGASGQVASLTAIGRRLFFAAPRADDPAGRIVPWTSDGSDQGTALLTRARIEVEPYTTPFVKLRDRVFFAASDPAHGEELWSTDGSAAGTARLLEIAPGLLDAQPRELTARNGRLYFRARDALHGMELWSTDGTAEGTRLIQDVFPGATWSQPRELTVTEQGLYFSAHDPAHGRELWLLPMGALDP